MRLRIWLVGGTTESVDLANILVPYHLPCIVTVISPSAQHHYPQSSELHVHTGALNPSTIESFLHDHHIAAILDASHPYATEISNLAMSVATHFQLPYLRFERSSPSTGTSTNNGLIIEVDSVSQLLQDKFLRQQRVLLTIGRTPLHRFRDWHGDSTLFARVLPQSQALQTALAAGFRCDRIIALQPPISFALEKALWQQWQISVVITKASGQPGGEPIKRQVAQALGVSLVIIKRPTLAYPQQTSDLQTALQFCQTALNHPQG